MKAIILAAFPLLGSAAAAPNLASGADRLMKRDSQVYRAENPSGTPILSQVTVTLINKMSQTLSTAVYSNNAAGVLISGAETTIGTMAPQATATLVAPMNWAGNLAFVQANCPIAGNDFSSLLEFGLSLQDGITKMDVDASYVNGYSGSLSCKCNDGSNKFLSGCNKDLWSLSSCGAEGEVHQTAWGACQNPYRDEGSHSGNESSPFFRPCQHKAYTYYNDDTANSNGHCLTGDATCCIGNEADGCSV